MMDRHADDWAADGVPVHRIPAAPDHVPVSRPHERAVAGGLAGVLVCAVLLLALLAAILILVASERVQRTTQPGPGTGEAGRLLDDERADLHACEDSGREGASHREWARLPHDGGRP